MAIASNFELSFQYIHLSPKNIRLSVLYSFKILWSERKFVAKHVTKREVSFPSEISLIRLNTHSWL
jgi:hypothetical protein